ncbi:hypothetical protein SJ05684_c32900 [Sinorhizobium sojae CCBAU 05684]|uniref:Uncharacterized protein n=1 Tax=Sinorhizobium sojae CCBAU 05684 TaxID=716928 RepID=A0A249PG39_9HYPH|nr:hypothetical protein SJ05684_c32900 [Sinorhizobium sojae CCBAU 05684]
MRKAKRKGRGRLNATVCLAIFSVTLLCLDIDIWNSRGTNRRRIDDSQRFTVCSRLYMDRLRWTRTRC